MAVVSYLSRFTVFANTWGIAGTCDGDTSGPLYLPAGTYYLDSATAAESLVAAIDTLLGTLFPAESFTVTYSMATGKVTVQCDSLGVAATWTLTFSGGLEDAIGFGAAPQGFAPTVATAVTSPEVCQYCIFAGSGRSQWSGTASAISNAEGTSDAGVSSGVGSSNKRLKGSWMHAHERLAAVASPLESGTRDDADAVRPWTWQDFFDHHRSTHHPFRFYDGTGLTVSQYERAYKLTGKSLGDFGPQNPEEGSWYYWQVPLEVREWKAATP